MGGEHPETADAVGTGISRRDMIAKSVVAGGLVWAVPTLTSTAAGALTGCPCEGGVQTTIKVPSQPAANCGVACLSQRERFNFPCLDDLANCLFDAGFISFDTAVFQNGSQRQAKIVLTGGITLLAAAVKTQDNCVFADCSENYCPNTGTETGQIIVCPGGTSGGNCSDTGFPGGTRIGNSTTPALNCSEDSTVTEILFDTKGDPINHIELALCIPNALTGQCP